MSEEFYALEAANWRNRALAAEAELAALKAKANGDAMAAQMAALYALPDAPPERTCDNCDKGPFRDPYDNGCMLTGTCVPLDRKWWKAKEAK